MKNYKAEYRSSSCFDISKTDEELGNYNNHGCYYVVVKNLGEAKKYLKQHIKAEREQLALALWSVDNVLTKEKIC